MGLYNELIKPCEVEVEVRKIKHVQKQIWLIVDGKIVNRCFWSPSSSLLHKVPPIRLWSNFLTEHFHPQNKQILQTYTDIHELKSLHIYKALE